MLRKLHASVFAAVAASGMAVCAAQAPETWDGLERVEDTAGNFEAVYVRPGVNLDDYDKILLRPVEVSLAERWEDRLAAGVKGLREEDAIEIRNDVAEIALQVFSEGFRSDEEFQLVNEPASDTAIVRISILDFDLAAASPDRFTEADKVLADDPLDMILLAEVFDAQTGRPVARIVGREHVKNLPIWDIVNHEMNMGEVRQSLQSWESSLRQAFNEVGAEEEGLRQAAAPDEEGAGS